MFERLKNLADSLNNLDLNKVIDEVLIDLVPNILDLNRQQLIDGETSTGEMIRPKYTEDPYFKSRGQALGYARWKHKEENEGRIPKSDSKYFTAPNLYINGYFHSLIEAEINETQITIDAHGFGEGFDNKYKNIYGLQPDNLDKIKNKLKDNAPKIQNKLRSKIKI